MRAVQQSERVGDTHKTVAARTPAGHGCPNYRWLLWKYGVLHGKNSTNNFCSLDLLAATALTKGRCHSKMRPTIRFGKHDCRRLFVILEKEGFGSPYLSADVETRAVVE